MKEDNQKNASYKEWKRKYEEMWKLANEATNEVDKNRIMGDIFKAAFEADKINSIERLTKRNYETEKRTRTVAQNIKHYRKANNMSQEKLAETMSCDRGTIINWENGTHIPNALQIEDLARIFGIEVGELHTKQVWNINQGNNERKRIAKYEQEWLKNHPVMITKAKEGCNRFNCFDFYRDYCWIGKDGFFVVALELLNRGYKVTRFDGRYMNDMNQTLYEGEFGGEMLVYINKDQIRAFEDAVSEILIDYASNTSRFDSVIDLRKKYIEKYFNHEGHMDEYIEEYVKELVGNGKFYNLFCSARIMQENGEELVFVGTFGDLEKKLDELGHPDDCAFSEILSGAFEYMSEKFRARCGYNNH